MKDMINVTVKIYNNDPVIDEELFSVSNKLDIDEQIEKLLNKNGYVYDAFEIEY